MVKVNIRLQFGVPRMQETPSLQLICSFLALQEHKFQDKNLRFAPKASIRLAAALRPIQLLGSGPEPASMAVQVPNGGNQVSLFCAVFSYFV